MSVIENNTPKWLDELIDDVAGCVECIPPAVGFRSWSVGEDGWEVELYPGPTEIDGERVAPTASIYISDVMQLFKEPNVIWSERGIEIGGNVGDEYVTLTLLRMAPDDARAVTRMLPGPELGWIDIEVDPTAS